MRTGRASRGGRRHGWGNCLTPLGLLLALLLLPGAPVARGADPTPASGDPVGEPDSLDVPGAPGLRDADPAPASRDPVGEPDPTALGVFELEADLLRRHGGEWVIVRLAVPDRTGPQAPGSRAPGESADAAPVRAALEEYRLALESRDSARLGRVWIMNPNERANVQRLFGQSAAVAVRIDDPVVRVDGDRARVRFDQQLMVSDGSELSARLRSGWRSLFAHDAVGSWTLDEVLEED